MTSLQSEGAATSSVPRDALPRLSGPHSAVVLGGVMGAPRGLLAIVMFLRGDVFAVKNLRVPGRSPVGVKQSIEVEQMSSPVLKDVDGSQMLLAEGKSMAKVLVSEIVPPQTDHMHIMSTISSKINC